MGSLLWIIIVLVVVSAICPRKGKGILTWLQNELVQVFIFITKRKEKTTRVLYISDIPSEKVLPSSNPFFSFVTQEKRRKCSCCSKYRIIILLYKRDTQAWIISCYQIARRPCRRRQKKREDIVIVAALIIISCESKPQREETCCACTTR